MDNPGTRTGIAVFLALTAALTAIVVSPLDWLTRLD